MNREALIKPNERHVDRMEHLDRMQDAGGRLRLQSAAERRSWSGGSRVLMYLSARLRYAELF